MSWMSDSTGRPEEEQGHKPHNISISNHISTYLDSSNKSKQIEDLVFFDAVLSKKITCLHIIIIGSPLEKSDNGSIWVSPLGSQNSIKVTKSGKRVQKKAGPKYRKLPHYMGKTFISDIFDFFLKPKPVFYSSKKKDSKPAL